MQYSNRVLSGRSWASGVSGLPVKAAVLSLAVCLAMGSEAYGQNGYPDHTVKIVVPVAAGGAADISTRIVADHLSRKWGVQVIVENQAGGGGIIGARAVAESAPDGYTLLATPGSEFTITPQLKPDTKDLYAGFAPVGVLSINSMAIVANTAFEGNTLAELVEIARKQDAPLLYSTAHTGSAVHFAAEWVASAAGIALKHVPFKGGAPAAAAVAGGEVMLASLPVLVAKPFVEGGKLKPIAVTSAKRTVVAPDWPTAAEAGYDVDIAVWIGLFARKDTPPEILAKLQGDLAAVLADGDYRKQILAAGGEPGDVTGSDLAAKIEQESRVIGDIIVKTGISVE